MQLLSLVSTAAFAFLAPALVLLMVMGAASSGLQNTPRIVFDRIMPDFSRLSIRSGLGRMFGLRGFTEFLKGSEAGRRRRGRGDDPDDAALRVALVHVH